MNLQVQLNQHLDKLSYVFGQSFTTRIDASVKTAGALLYQVFLCITFGFVLHTRNAEKEPKDFENHVNYVAFCVFFLFVYEVFCFGLNALIFIL